MIKITEKNFPQIAGRLNKMFDQSKYTRRYEYWHTFDCGAKKRLHDYFYLNGEKINTKNQIVISDKNTTDTTFRLYYHYFSMGMYADHNCLLICIGDEILFLGNRIVLKRRFPSIDFKYIYTTVQITRQNNF